MSLVKNTSSEHYCDECGQPCCSAPPTGPNRAELSYLRSPMVRAVVSKALNPPPDPRTTMRYKCIKNKLVPELSSVWVQLDLDKETEEFLDNCEEVTSSLVRYYYHSAARSLLGKFISQTSVNGLLNRGQMFVTSTGQFEKLMTAGAVAAGNAAAKVSDLFVDPSHGTLLDVGAGDGAVTEKMTPYFAETFATEMSPVMVYRLNQRAGITAVQSIDLNCPELVDRTFDVVSCLNVLDRCDKPLTLCRELKAKLAGPKSRIIMAVVLPFCPFVDDGAKQKRPAEYVKLIGNCWEYWVNELVDKVFTPVGLAVEAVSRLPYISQGDFTKAVYTLDDVMFVLKAAPESPGTTAAGPSE